MKKIILFFGVMLLCSTFGFSQTSMSIGNVSAGSGEVLVPIDVENFANVAAISLKISYNSANLTFVGVENAPVTFTQNAAGGVITLGWFDNTASSPINIASGTLLELKFTSNGGSGSLDFISNQCEISDLLGNPLTVSYTNGSIIGVDAVGLALGTDDDAASGDTVVVPLDVVNFNGIGAISLKIDYDPTVLSYLGLANAPSGVTFTAGAAGGVITIGWFDNTGNTPINIGNGKLVDLKFVYNSGTSTLSFETAQCEVSDSAGAPIADVGYTDGGVSGSTITLTIGNVQANTNSSVNVPINVEDFNNVGAVSLKINYNASVLSFTGVSNSPAGVTFTANASSGVISIGWFDNTGTNPINLDSGKLLDLDFDYGSGSSSLTFDVANSEISNDLGVPYIGVVYNDGSVILNQGAAPTITIADVDAAPNTDIVVPVDVNNFNGIGAISLKIQYNAAILTFNGVSNSPAGVSFTANAVGGVINIGWFDNTGNSPINIAGDRLFDLNFAFTSGTSSLAFQTANCEIADSAGNPIIGVVYDDGSVSSASSTPVLTLANVLAFPNSSVSVPLTVERFNGVGAISMKIQYDPVVAEFVGVSNTPAGKSFAANATGGVITIGWFDNTGNSPISIDSAKLLDLDFNYTAGSTDLIFTTSQSEISDSAGVPIGDVNYNNGSISQEPSTATVVQLADVTTTVSDVSIPLTVKRFNGVGAISWKIQYNAAVVTFDGVENALVPFTSSAAGGVITLGWFDNTGNSPLYIDSTELLDLKFTYNAGSTNLTFFTVLCEVADSVGNPITGIVYIDGSISFNLPPEFTVELGDTSIKANVLFTFDYDATDPNGESLEFSLVNAPEGAEIDPVTGVFTWTPTLAQAENTYEIVAVVSDGSLTDTTRATSLEVTEVVDRQPGIPTKYALSQNFPNPFNPSTTIEFDIQSYSNVVLKIYNVLGQEVATLVNKEMPAGFYKYNFDASQLSSGAYIYRITAGDFVSTKKMLFIK